MVSFLKNLFTKKQGQGVVVQQDVPEPDETLSDSGEFYSAPTVIVIAGDTVRRFYTLHALTSMLRDMGHKVYAFSNSLTKKEFRYLERSSEWKGAFDTYTKSNFKKAYKSLQEPQQKKSFILLEMSLEQIIAFSFASHEVQTLVMTDIMHHDKDFVLQLQEKLSEQVRKQHLLQTVIYNNDTHVRDDSLSSAQFINIEEVPFRNHFSYGRASTSFINLQEEDNKVRISMPNLVMDLPYHCECSLVKREGEFAAISTLIIERVLHKKDEYVRPTSLSFLEETRSDGNTYFWMKFFESPEEMKTTLEIYDKICIGVSVYLRFEYVIESKIEDLDKVVVVAETTDQTELLTEYFLEKEKDSFHTIVYVPHIKTLPQIDHIMFGNSARCYMFDLMKSFTVLETKDLNK